MTDFDVIVIGAGPAGEVAAGRTARDGLRTAIVERELVGGECSYWGCMPSKALLRPGELRAEVERIPGLQASPIDVQAVLDRRDEVIHDFDDSGQLPWLQDAGVTLIRGEATVTGEREVTVNGETHTAAKGIVLASGTTAGIPPIDGLEDAHPWNNREITTTKDQPESLVIIGGGVIGAEMAQAWSSLGTTVTLLEIGDRILIKEEPFAADQVTEALREHGVDVRVGIEIESVARDDDGVTVTLGDGATVTAQEVAVTAGRRPRTDPVEGLGYEPGESVEVDDHYATTKHPDWLYAIGDVNGRVLLTHMGKYQASIVADRLAGKDSAALFQANDARSPRVTFTDPQVAAVGHTEHSAKEAGLNIEVVEVETSGNAGGSFYGRDAVGTARMIVDTDREVIVGATVTGSEVADFIHPFTIAIVAEVSMDRLWHAVPVFPTRSELWLRLLESYRK